VAAGVNRLCGFACYDATMTDRTDLDIDAIESRLRARRDELMATSATASDNRQPVELDQQRVGRLSRMDALQDQAMAQETERRRTIEMKRIEAALKRIGEGEYGYCDSCGVDIPKARLDLDPSTPTCVDCAK